MLTVTPRVAPPPRNGPDSHYHVFMLSESKFYAIYNGEKTFSNHRTRGQLHVFEYGGTTFGTFGKNCFKC